MSSRQESFDVIVVGTGIAGLSAAIRAAECGGSVCVLTKEGTAEECNTRYAQGGIVARGGPEDPDLLEQDILAAGCWLNNREAVSIVSREGPAAVEDLLLGRAKVPFLRNADGEVDLTREAAHSIRRIWHVKDYTGRAIQDALTAYARGIPGIHFFPSCMAVDIITNTHHSRDDSQRYSPKRALGVYVYGENTGEVVPFFARATILAAGGVGNLFLHTSNPPGATGDGIAMAERAGAEIINAEYVQFHPTILFHRDLKGFLISESLRGEGARLMNRKGEYFMDRYHPALKDLAPRDEVSRAIYYEMEQTESTYVLLDTSLLKVEPSDRFPSIYETCLKAGLDMRHDPVPVVPAAHYFCGRRRTWKGGLPFPASMPRARPPAPVSTAPIGWLPFPCWRALSLDYVPAGPRLPSPSGRVCPCSRAFRIGFFPLMRKWPIPIPHLSRSAEHPDDHVGLRGHSPDPEAPFPGEGRPQLPRAPAGQLLSPSPDRPAAVGAAKRRGDRLPDSARRGGQSKIPRLSLPAGGSGLTRMALL